MDCTNLKFKDEMFDFVIDKSTIDALLCAKMLSEVSRVLKSGGVYIIISYGEPDNRTFHFERNHLDFEYTTIPLNQKGTSQANLNSSPYLKDILQKIISNIILICFKFLNSPILDSEEGSGENQIPHYAYILKKGQNAQQKYIKNYKQVFDELIKEEEEDLLKYGSLDVNPFQNQRNKKIFKIVKNEGRY